MAIPMALAIVLEARAEVVVVVCRTGSNGSSCAHSNTRCIDKSHAEWTGMRSRHIPLETSMYLHINICAYIHILYI